MDRENSTDWEDNRSTYERAAKICVAITLWGLCASNKQETGGKDDTSKCKME